jgi:hypothetical protein
MQIQVTRFIFTAVRIHVTKDDENGAVDTLARRARRFVFAV